MPLAPRIRRDRRAALKKFSPAKQFERKRCKNCPKMFPKTRPNREFCTPACKKEFHRHGSAFGPLKETLQNLVKGWLRSFQEDTDQNTIAINKRLDLLERRQGIIARELIGSSPTILASDVAELMGTTKHAR